MLTFAACLIVSTLGAGRAWDSAWFDAHRLGAAKGPYFLVDDRVTEDRWLIERFVDQPERHPANPLIVKEHAWEGTGPHMGGSVLYDEDAGLFRMWYSVWNSHAYYNRLPFSYNVCYAESDDGLAWRKPALGVFDEEADPANNIIRLGTDKTQNIDVMLNPKPGQFPGKFLAIHNQMGGVFVSSSDDGKSFSRMWPEKPAISYHSDTHNNFIYDEVGDYWLLFCRPRAHAGDHRRRVAIQLSPDLENWTHERVILVPTETEAPEYYGMTVFRRGGLFFGALQIFDRGTQTLYPELAWSGDGIHWTQLPTHKPFLPVGAPGTWDAGMVMVAESPVVRGDAMYFYYGGFALTHDQASENAGAIGLAVAERDRIAGVRPSSDAAGTVLTRLLRHGGKRLLVNARVMGELRAELRVGVNRPIEGFTFDDCDPVTASSFAAELTWVGKALGDAPEQELRIAFQLTGAELFTFDLLP